MVLRGYLGCMRFLLILNLRIVINVIRRERRMTVLISVWIINGGKVGGRVGMNGYGF